LEFICQFRKFGLGHGAFRMWLLSRKLLNYGLDQDNPNLRMMLVTSRSGIQDKSQLDIPLAMASYLTKHVLYEAKMLVDSKNPENYTLNYLALTELDPYHPPTSWLAMSEKNPQDKSSEED
jgi:hypothetical protein